MDDEIRYKARMYDEIIKAAHFVYYTDDLAVYVAFIKALVDYEFDKLHQWADESDYHPEDHKYD